MDVASRTCGATHGQLLSTPRVRPRGARGQLKTPATTVPRSPCPSIRRSLPLEASQLHWVDLHRLRHPRGRGHLARTHAAPLPAPAPVRRGPGRRRLRLARRGRDTRAAGERCRAARGPGSARIRRVAACATPARPTRSSPSCAPSPSTRPDVRATIVTRLRDDSPPRPRRRESVTWSSRRSPSSCTVSARPCDATAGATTPSRRPDGSCCASPGGRRCTTRTTSGRSSARSCGHADGPIGSPAAPSRPHGSRRSRSRAQHASSSALPMMTAVIFKRVGEGRPYPDHGLAPRDWASLPPASGAARRARHHQGHPPAGGPARRGLDLLR